MSPKSWIDFLLELALKERFQDEVIGDLHEWFHLQQKDGDGRALHWRYAWSALKSLKSYQLKRVSNLLITLIDLTMISNYIKLGVRSLLKNRRFTLINMLGLGSAFCTVVFIYAYVAFELSFDQYHHQVDNIYKVLSRDLVQDARSRSTPTPLKNAFQGMFGEELTFARFGQDPVFVELEDAKFYEEHFYWADAEVFSVFDLPFLYGDPRTALREPNTVVISEELSKKYFGEDVDPVGKSLPVKVFDSNVELTLRIDGVMRQLPANTDLPFDALGSMANALDMYSRFAESWGFNWLHTFVLVPDKQVVSEISKGMPNLITNALGEQFRDRLSFELQPLAQMHLHSSGVRRSGIDGDIRDVRVFALVGIFIIIIATMNYINLTSSRIPRRSREVAVRKVHGAGRNHIIRQLVTELLVLSGASFLIALVVVLLLWPFFTGLAGKEIDAGILLSLEFFGLILVVFSVSGLLAGLYPAMVMAAISPLQGLQGEVVKRKKQSLRGVLVTLQFAISIFLLICTGVVFDQLRYMVNANLGIEASQLINIKVEDRSLQQKIETLRDQLGTVSGVEAVALSGEELPSLMNNTWGFSWDAISAKERHGIHIVAVDEGFFQTVQLKLKAGQNFFKPYRVDSSRSVVLNSAAWNLITTDKKVGMEVTIGGHSREVIGVTEDYHFRSLHEGMEPIVFMISRPGLRISPDNIFVRVAGQNMIENISLIENKWEQLAPGAAFDFHFVDRRYEGLYAKEQRFLKLFGIFSSLSIIIACLGLLGVVLYVVSEKMKEISIRKVLGSSVSQIGVLIGRQFGIFISLGALLAVPVAIYALRRWLQQFAYDVGISTWIVAGALVLAFLIALVTIGSNLVSALQSNPVKYLRDE